MPSSNSAFDTVVDEILEMPLFYQAAKTLLQLNPFPPCQFACSMSLASLSSIQGNNEFALREVNRAIKLEPMNADAHLQKGIISLT
jgi:Flp pilus assembly protein TadD